MDPAQLPKSAVRVHRALIGIGLAAVLACSTLPETKIKHYTFPKNVYVGDAPKDRPYVGSPGTELEFAL